MAVPLFLEGRVINIAKLHQQLIKLRFDRADRNKPAISAGVAAIKRRAAIENVLPSAAPLPALFEFVVHGAEQRGAV
ncbi:hypothetical protein D3C81_2084260 [compost metagenome]